MVARSIFSYLRLDRPRYRKTAGRDTARTPEENQRVAELICRTPRLFCEDLQTWATDQLLPLYEERRRARQAFYACNDEVRPPKNEE